MPRRFALLNSVGARFDLMRKDAYFHKPDGLGKSRSHDTMSLGDFLFSVDNNLDNEKITGEMVFRGYAQYSEFVAFCGDSVTLLYCPAGSTWYRRDCLLVKLDKSEIEQGGRLICNIDFQPTSPWYLPATVHHVETQTDGGKIFPVTYPFTWRDSAAGSVTLRNNSYQPAPLRVVIAGPVANPQWSLTVGTSIIATGKVTATIASGETLVCDAFPSPGKMEIAKYNVQGVRTDMFAASDFSTERFLYAPPGTSTVYLSAGGSAIDTDSWIEVRELYDTV